MFILCFNIVSFHLYFTDHKYWDICPVISILFLFLHGRIFCFVVYLFKLLAGFSGTLMTKNTTKMFSKIRVTMVIFLHSK